jgi:hypothetical protein
MAGTPKEYQRLPGRAMGLAGNWALWLGGDHLLLVARFGYTETYKRFYFKDIQAVTIRRTARATVWNCVLGLLALLFCLPALATVDVTGQAMAWILGGFFALLALINLLRGTTCVTHIKTPVQTEQVPAWGRLRAVRKGMDRIRPLLLEAQGASFPEELKAELTARLRRETEVPPAQSN